MSTRKRYTKEFKLEAVRLLEQGDRGMRGQVSHCNIKNSS